MPIKNQRRYYDTPSWQLNRTYAREITLFLRDTHWTYRESVAADVGEQVNTLPIEVAEVKARRVARVEGAWPICADRLHAVEWIVSTIVRGRQEQSITVGASN